MENNKVRAVLVHGDMEGLHSKVVLFSKHQSAIEYFYRILDIGIPFIIQDDDGEGALDYYEIKASLLAKVEESNWESLNYTARTEVIGNNNYLFAQVFGHHESYDMAFELREINIYESASAAETAEGLDIEED